MGWRKFVPCCGVPAPSATKFYCCCGGGMHEDAAEEDAAEEPEKSFVFLEQFPTDKKVLSPLVPFIGELPVTLYPGRVIFIDGRVQQDAIRMSVNLACGTTKESDLAFHLNPRFEQNLVVRNFRLKNQWGMEETSSPRKFPFKRGEKFYIQLFTTDDEFLVALNGQHFCAYTYRLPLVRIQVIEVFGDVDISSVEYKTIEEYPIPHGEQTQEEYEIGPTQPLSEISKKLLQTPMTCVLSTGFNVGTEIEVLGRVKLLPHSFYINFQDGTQVWPHPTIPLHINPRFQAGRCGGVVRNAWVKGKWGSEEKAPIWLFRPGRTFVIKFRCEEDVYLVSVDGATTARFLHRAPPQIVNSLYIHGDVLIRDIVINENVNAVTEAS